MPYIPGQKAKAFFTQTKQLQPDNTAANKMGTYGAVAQGQTNAIGDEVQSVVKKSQDVNKVDTSFKTDNFTKQAQQPFKIQMPINQYGMSKPVQFGGGETAEFKDLTQLNKSLPQAEADLSNIQKTQTELDQGINKYGEQRMGELNKQSEQYQKNVGDLNMGQVGAESEVEQNSNDFLKLLAERDPSNIGILKNLYGNYDSTKYGAVDSNVLQGIINENRGEAENILKLRTQAEGSVDPAMKLYQKELDSLKNRTTEDYKKYGETTKALMDKYRTDASGFADKVADMKIKQSELSNTVAKQEDLKKQQKPYIEKADSVQTLGPDEFVKWMKSNEGALKDVGLYDQMLKRYSDLVQERIKSQEKRPTKKSNKEEYVVNETLDDWAYNNINPVRMLGRF